MTKEDQLLNRSEIIRMAQEASNNASGLYEENNDLVMLYLDELERFAALIAAAAKAEEREACAKVCETKAGSVVQSNTNRGRVNQAVIYAAGVIEDCAAAIRARGRS